LYAAAALVLTACSSAPKRDVAPRVETVAATNTAPTRAKRQQFRLTAEAFWRIELPAGQRFDASGLVWHDGRLLIVADAVPTLFEVEFGETNTARLRDTKMWSAARMASIVGNRPRYDLEGLARDESGRIYVCEEGTRAIFRADPVALGFEKLNIDWASVQEFFSADSNASFEGVAVGGGRLWVANERERPRVIEVDLAGGKVVGDYAPVPSTWGLVTHYSDICWFNGRLFLLLRHHRVILEIDAERREVLAEYNYEAMEEAPEHRYLRAFPTGTMEGLTVDEEYFWLVTDNNGFGRAQASDDRRPTLFKCKRPAR
jgi:hypothetical protein